METKFDDEKADRAVEFIETYLVHTKGSFARQRFVLADFQKEIIRGLFGTLMRDPEFDDWVRLYRLLWLEVARKNGKSELMAAIALLLTGGDDEESAEVYGVARDVEQASLVFNVAKRMVELSPKLTKHFKPYPRYREIVYRRTGSRYKVIPGDALGNLGHDPHGILFDEIISQPNGELWDTLKTAFGARRQPLMVAATTAGNDPGSFAKAEHDFSARVSEDQSLDPRRMVYIRAADHDAAMGDEEAWEAANPALGLFLRPQALRDDLQEAENNPRAERAFRQFRLNQWLDTPSQTWIGLEEWDLTAGMVDESKLGRRPCYGGLVAASATDLTALAWTFPPKTGTGWETLWRFFIPEDALAELAHRTNGDAERWAKDKLSGLRVTEGNEIDIDAHIDQIRADIKAFDVRELAWDSHGVLGITQKLNVEFGPKRFVAVAPNTPGSALLDWERLIRARDYAHSANPIARWMLGHAMVREGASGVLRIDRKNSTEDVSGIYAAELALRRALVAVAKPKAVLHGASF